MSSPATNEAIRTKIWLEEPEPDNPFATRAAYCHGYDVFGEMLGRARWVDMLFLLFRGEAPSEAQAMLLESLAVALMNPGPRDPAVHAAMCAGVGGSTSAAALMATLAVGAGQYTGAREVRLVMQRWDDCGVDLTAWECCLKSPLPKETGIWPVCEHPPGFDPHGVSTTTVVRQSLQCLAQLSPGQHLSWLLFNYAHLEQWADQPLAISGVAATALVDLGFTPEQGEILYLLLRLPGAAAHAIEQRAVGYKSFPFFALDLQDDPAQSCV
ncbi:MAG: citryl-CoA lyase [Rhizobacter sp.]